MTYNENASSFGFDDLVHRIIGGNFRIERLIGSGAMGNVYRAEQLSLGKAVAIKVLHPQLMADEKLVRRFQREAKSASRLNHPNSIQIIDSGQDAAGILYIAMELLSGRDLGQVIRDEFPLPIPRIVRIMSQVLSALDEAHTHGVIHRDLKPSNIMLVEQRGEADFVKVCDYGIAKAQLDDDANDGQMLTIQGLVCGTPEYMSPEQARGEPLDGRADLYSAAVILYQMVTGDIPFRAATPLGIVSRHLSEAPAVPSTCLQAAGGDHGDPTIPPALDDLILRGLAKTRELRPPTANRFLEELESISPRRSDRHARASSSTVPATEAVSDAALTNMLPAAPRTTDRTSVSRRGAVVTQPVSGGRPAKALAIGIVLTACAAAAALILIRRAHPPRTPTATAAEIVPRPIANRAPAPTGTAATAVTPTVVAMAPAGAGRAAVQAPSESPPGTLGNSGVDEPATAGGSSTAKSRDLPDDGAPRAHVGASTSGGTAGSHDRPARHRRDDARIGTTIPVSAVARPTSGAAPPGPAMPTEPAPPPAHATANPASDATAAPAEAKAAPANHGGASARDLIGDGERLLAQGDATEACRRGEDAKKVSPNTPAIYKFLGKCYMRAGNVGAAKDNYRRYLELAPSSADAVFIESIVK